MGPGDRGENREEETSDDEQADLPGGEEGHPKEPTYTALPVPPVPVLWIQLMSCRRDHAFQKSVHAHTYRCKSLENAAPLD